MRLHTAVLAASLPLTNGGQAQLLPAGTFAARDGRPGPGKKWTVTNERGAALAAALTAVAASTPVVIDYEHQTLNAAANGRPAPAAGWINRADWRNDQGLYADVEWTAAARAAIDAGEYRYISPVIQYGDDGVVKAVALAALTNYPALTGMDQVIAQLNAELPLSRSTTSKDQDDMELLAALRAALALKDTATEGEALSAVAELKQRADAPPPVPTALVTALGLQADASEAAALSAVASLKQADTTTIAALQTQVNTLTAKINDGAVSGAVDAAIAAGKLTVGNRQLYVEIGRKDMAQLTTLLAAMPVIPGLSANQSGGKDPAAGAGAADANAALSSAEALKVAHAMGISTAEWTKAITAAKA